VNRANGVYRLRLDDAEIHYELSGAGEPLLLIHGGTGTGTYDWRLQRAAFAEKYRVISPDLRAHGRSSGPVESITHHGMAEDLTHLLDELNIEAVHNCGFSVGGIFLMELAIAHPERVRSLTTVGSAFRVDPNFESRAVALAQNWPSELRGLHGDDRGDDYWRRLLMHLTGDWMRSGGLSPTQLATIAAPTLIIFGDRDENVALDQGLELYNLFQNARLLVVPRARHAVQLERPDLVTTEILRFLADVERYEKK